MSTGQTSGEPGRITTVRIAKVAVWFVYIVLLYVLIILALAFFLLLFNANPDSGFAEWVYRSADRVMEPFRGIFPTTEQGNGSVVDFSILFAMLVYGILAMIVNAVINWLDAKIRAWQRQAEIEALQPAARQGQQPQQR